MVNGLILVGHFPEFKDGGVLHQCRPTKGLGAHGPVDWNSPHVVYQGPRVEEDVVFVCVCIFWWW